MTDHTMARTQSMIEELRADIDFEIDDVIADIVRGLPEDYFKCLSGDDQQRQLKALLGLRLCQFDEEVFLASEEERQVSVVATRNYAGQLAGILKRLPRDQKLRAARIFTSTAHDFIIDVFDFERDVAQAGLSESGVAREALCEEVALLSQAAVDAVTQFVDHYPSDSPLLLLPQQLALQYQAYRRLTSERSVVIDWLPIQQEPRYRVTLCVGHVEARQVFERAAEFFGGQGWDIQQAWLHEVPWADDGLAALASFIVAADPAQAAGERLSEVARALTAVLATREGDLTGPAGP